MLKYGSYLVCNEYIGAVKEFLSQFFEEKVDAFNDSEWVTLQVSGGAFKINLMMDREQPLTQYITFEIYCSSQAELEQLAEKHSVEVKNFPVTDTSQPYTYYYAELFGPANICKIELNYIEGM